MNSKLHNRLFYRQAKNTALVALILVVILSIFQIFYDLRKEKEFIDTTIIQVLSTVKESATQATYTLDNKLAAKVVEGLFNYRPIYRARVIDDFDTILANQKRALTTGRLQWMADYLFGADLQYALPLLSPINRKPLGRVEVFVDSYRIAVNFLNRTKVTIIASSLLVIVLAAALTVMFYITITRPLLNIAGSLSQLRPSKHPLRNLRIPRGHERDEIGTLVQAINSTGNARVESEEKYRLLVENSNDGIIVAQGGLLKFHNSSTRNLLGASEEELNQTPFIQFIAPEYRPLVLDRYRRRLKGEELPSPYPIKVVSKAGRTFWVLLSSVRIMWERQPATLNFVKDISDQKELESRLKQAHKMEAIGTLAGGIAHDFNNILGIILGNTELAMEDVPKSNPAHSNLEEIKNASIRAKDVIRQLLGFSRKTEHKLKPVKISPLIKECVKFLRLSIPSSIEIHQNLSAYPDVILGDSTQIHQVMINLCTNAAHAMEEAGGILEIDLFNVQLDQTDMKKYPDLQPGPHIILTVRDTGSGIESDIKERIFDPYYTTKEIDKGTGMGLAVVHGIVKSHGGFISIESKVEVGTAVHVLFPVVDAEEKEVVVESSRDMPKGSERILFIDDEPSIIKFQQQMLERLGYECVPNLNPLEAIKLFKSNPSKFDLVITDFTMPQMTGEKLADEILKIRPDIPIILCTGYSDKIDEQKTKELGIHAYVMKPIVMHDLATTIRKVFDS